MKQLKILVALIAGLFSFTSANAGEMTVSGTMQATYQSEGDDVTGNPLGLNTDLTFTGTTEVLNGTAVTWSLATDGTSHVTLTAGTGITLVGCMVISAQDLVEDAFTSGVARFRVRRVSSSAVTLYRIG